ncbi:MAG: PAS domain-containing protein [Gammaproteobacteria bacterium]|nr:PAS domain-containing protein [Gammaproteobacteria bacterium]
MKQRITATNHEYQVGDEEFIVSKTDTKGRITYVNRVFMKVARFNEDQLLGQQHNIIRHPDMPRGVFKFLWDTISQGDECFAFVKNLAADGSYYWVFANVTPDYDESGTIIKGYFSVRRKPSLTAINTITPIYQEMLALEQRVGAAEACSASIALLTSKIKKLNTEYFDLVHHLQNN